MRIEPLDWWIATFGEIAPIGHVLRGHLHEQWTRFHSLPQSKRYAENDGEYAELLQRHLNVGSALFQPREVIVVLHSEHHARKDKPNNKRRRHLGTRQLREKMIELPVLASDKVESGYWQVRAIVTSWIPDFFADLNQRIADEQDSGVAFISPTTKNIYCPYDGGMDIFSFSISPQSLEEKFRHWMSGRPDKL